MQDTKIGKILTKKKKSSARQLFDQKTPELKRTFSVDTKRINLLKRRRLTISHWNVANTVQTYRKSYLCGAEV